MNEQQQSNYVSRVLMLNSGDLYEVGGGGRGCRIAVPSLGADLPSATHLKDALFLNLLRFLTVSCGGGSFNLGSHHSLLLLRKQDKHGGGCDAPGAASVQVLWIP